MENEKLENPEKSAAVTNKKYKPVIVIACAAAVIALFFVLYKDIAGEKSDTSFFSMDTYITAVFSGKRSGEAAEKFRELIEALDSKTLSRQNKNSEISKLNAGGGKMSEDMQKYINDLLDVSRKSGGKFDPALGAVSDLWNFGSSPAVPDGDALKAALRKSGSDKIIVDGDNLTVRDGAIIDFGSTGKGIALDETKKLLEQLKIKEATVSVGGSVLVYGDREFNVGIRDPKGGSMGSIMTVKTRQTCVSTSGSYEQRFEQDGKAYHHIIDPQTGYPVENGLVSVTVISESGFLSDALSTACFVLGVEKGSELAGQYDCEVIFVTDENKIYTSDGIRDFVKITDSGYSFAVIE